MKKISISKESAQLIFGGYVADLPFTCMVLRKIQDQKQKYNLESPIVDAHIIQ